MKILRIIYEWPPPWIGLVPQPFEITRAQVAKGHDITVFCGRWPFAGSLVEIPGVDIRSFWREPVKGTWGLTTAPLLFVYYLLWRTIQTPDVVHAHGHIGLWIFFYRNLLSKVFKRSKELKIPLVAHFHITAQGRWTDYKASGKPISKIAEKLAWPMEVWANNLAVKAASAYIFTSEEVKNEAIKYYNADPTKCFVVETGVNPAIFKPVNPDEKEKTRKELNLLPVDKVILNYGFLVERKNPHLLVEALKFLPVQYKVMFVGSGDSSYMEKIKEIISKNNLGDRVIQIGYTPYPDIPVAIQASDIFVLPSTYEGMPKVVFESLSCGVPVLASGFKPQEELGGLHFIQDFAPEKLAEQIKDIVEKETFVDVNKVRALYSWQRKADQIEQVYETLK